MQERKECHVTLLLRLLCPRTGPTDEKQAWQTEWEKKKDFLCFVMGVREYKWDSGVFSCLPLPWCCARNNKMVGGFWIRNNQ